MFKRQLYIQSTSTWTGHVSRAQEPHVASGFMLDSTQTKRLTCSLHMRNLSHPSICRTGLLRSQQKRGFLPMKATLRLLPMIVVICCLQCPVPRQVPGAPSWAPGKCLWRYPLLGRPWPPVQLLVLPPSPDGYRKILIYLRLPMGCVLKSSASPMIQTVRRNSGSLSQRLYNKHQAPP